MMRCQGVAEGKDQRDCIMHLQCDCMEMVTVSFTHDTQVPLTSPLCVSVLSLCMCCVCLCVCVCECVNVCDVHSIVKSSGTVIKISPF